MAEERDFPGAAIANAEAELEVARAEVAMQVSALQRTMEDAFDWRRWFRRHPAAFLAGALGIGYLVGRRR